MKHRYKSIDGAVRRIRQLEEIVADYRDITDRYAADRNTLAKLAAKGPAFFNPLEAMAAEEVRDRILASMGMNPDGTFKKRVAP